mmetsp:Transcript_26484/g.67338  ORF Transcript_26484/g.67338 Transcript_26484/m.67338 type:complete len:214 (+) Transcript_26484:465-1106(+)
MAAGRGPASASFTLPTISATLAGTANACSRSGLAVAALACAATRTAVTLVMNDSMGSTATLVTAMMNASHTPLSAFSSSFLLSTWYVSTRGPPVPSILTTALLDDSVNSDDSPARMRRRWSRMCVKSRSMSVAAKSTSKGAICSRRNSRCLIMKSCASSGPALRATCRLACCTLLVHAATASWARPPNVRPSTARYSLDKHSSVERSGGYRAA